MSKKYLNTAFSLAMLKPPFTLTGEELSAGQAAQWIRESQVENVCNPQHTSSLDAVSRILQEDVRAAKGGRTILQPGDEMLVAQIIFPSSVPREAIYTDEQLAQGQFTFILVKVS